MSAAQELITRFNELCNTNLALDSTDSGCEIVGDVPSGAIPALLDALRKVEVDPRDAILAAVDAGVMF